MTIRACVVFPIYITLTNQQETEYKSLSQDEKEGFLLDLADHYLSQSSVIPVIEYVENDQSESLGNIS